MAIQSIKIQCQQCHNQEPFKVGYDDKEDSIDKAIKNFQGKTQIQLRSIIKKHTINQAQYGYAIFQCPQCGRLYNHYFAEVEYDNIMLFKPFHKCSTCNSTLLRISEPPQSYTCQQCAQQSTA